MDFNKFPNERVKTLLALEDLGRGSTGKAWLCVSLTESHSAACVLKFDNRKAQSEKLAFERTMWVLLYPEFSHMVKVERWSGADALVMPHFSTVLKQEREHYRAEVMKVLDEKFVKNGKVHQDVHWHNIGMYKKKDEVAIVVYDLLNVIDYDDTIHNGWDRKVIISLYGTDSGK